MATATISVDEFQALEQKVLQTVDLIRRERELRMAAEAQIATLREQLASVEESQMEIENLKRDTNSLLREREIVRQRVERMLASLEEIVPQG
jgi:FtsZ-binding cell division protein ZapB